MKMLGAILMLVGGITNLVGAVMLLAAAKRVGVGWFIGCLFTILLPFFCIAYWQEARKPFCLWISGFLVAGIGTMIAHR
jgi:hypothetical protein